MQNILAERIYKDPIVVPTPFWRELDNTKYPAQITLDCEKIDPDGNLDRAKISFNKKGKAQYNITYGYAEPHPRQRPILTRVFFIENDDFGNPEYTVSHLCHNELCVNKKHLAFETLQVNQSRNGCAGGPLCRHFQRCIRPGHYSSAGPDGVPHEPN